MTSKDIHRPANLRYALDEQPPFPYLVLLGAQYAVMAAIYLVLVVIILRHTQAGDSKSLDALGTACLGLGIGAALQALPRGPIGSGFLAPPVFSAVYLAPSVLAAEAGGIPLVLGLTLFAGIVEFLVALLLNRLRILITPVLSGLMILVVGLQLGIVGIGETLDVRHEALPAFPLHLMVTTLTLSVCVALSIWGRGIVKLLCSISALAAGMAMAMAIGLFDPARLAALGHASWIAAPHLSLFQMQFDIRLAPAFAAAAVAAALRAVGVITTCQRINNSAWERPDRPNIRRGVLADALSNIIGAAIGVPGMSIAPSLVAVSGATGATSRVIGFATAIILGLFAFSPKLSGIFLLVPQEVAGSLLVFTSAFMIAGGMQVILSQSIDARATYVVGISTLLALSVIVYPRYFQDLPAPIRSFANSPLVLCLFAAVGLTLLFRFGARQSGATTWNKSEGSIAAAIDFLRSKARSWKVAASLSDNTVAQTRDVITYIAQSGALNGENALRASFDGLELQVDITYSGSQATRPLPISSGSTSAVEDELENEEAVAYVGLRNFLRTLAVDRHKIKIRRDRVLVRLVYSV